MSTDFQTNALFPAGDGRCGIIYENPYPNGIPGDVFKVTKDKAWTDKVHDFLWNSETMSVTSNLAGAWSWNDNGDWEAVHDIDSTVSGDFHGIVGEDIYDGGIVFYDGDPSQTSVVYALKLKKPHERVCFADSALNAYWGDLGDPSPLLIQTDLTTIHGENKNFNLDTDGKPRPAIDVEIETYYDIETSGSVSRTYTEGGITTDFTISMTNGLPLSFGDDAHTIHRIGIEFIHILSDGSSEVYVRVKSFIANARYEYPLPQGISIYRDHTLMNFAETPDLVETRQIEIFGETVDAEVLLFADAYGNNPFHIDVDDLQGYRIDNFAFTFDAEATELYT